MPHNNPVESGVIVAKWINEPKPGKTKFNIKTDNNDFYLCSPAVAATMQQGGTYKVQYEVHQFNGQTYKTIKWAQAAETPAPQAAAAPGARPTAAVNDTPEHIFVCGLLNGFARAGNLLPGADVQTEVVQLGRALRLAYREIWKPMAPSQPARPAAPPQRDPEMDDEIPF